MKSNFIILSFTLYSCLSQISCKEKSDKTDAKQTENKKEVINDKHNAENSLDILGIYKGELPCADCPGIKVTIVLEKDKKFISTYDYIDRDATFTQKGEYLVEDNLLTTVSGNDTTFYKIGENTITQLMKDKQPVTGELASMFILKKAQEGDK